MNLLEKINLNFNWFTLNAIILKHLFQSLTPVPGANYWIEFIVMFFKSIFKICLLKIILVNKCSQNRKCVTCIYMWGSLVKNVLLTISARWSGFIWYSLYTMFFFKKKKRSYWDLSIEQSVSFLILLQSHLAIKSYISNYLFGVNPVVILLYLLWRVLLLSLSVFYFVLLKHNLLLLT